MATCDLEPHNVLQCDGDPDNDVAGKTDSRSITPANASTSATASRSASASASVSASDSMDEDIDEEEEDADDDEEDETELKWTALQGAKSLIVRIATSFLVLSSLMCMVASSARMMESS